MFWDRFVALCAENNTKPTPVVQELGLSIGSVTRWKNGAVPGATTQKKIADYFGVTVGELLGEETARVIQLPSNVIPLPTMRKVPLVGTIACGTPIVAEENWEGEVDVPEHVRADFALRCRGDSMINARIHDGDLVYIRAQDMVEDGEIAAVLIGEEATLKRVHFADGQVILSPENSAFAPMVLSGADMDGVRIIGKAVAFLSNVK